jgi:hypothetical protein
MFRLKEFSGVHREWSRVDADTPSKVDEVFRNNHHRLVRTRCQGERQCKRGLSVIPTAKHDHRHPPVLLSAVIGTVLEQPRR